MNTSQLKNFISVAQTLNYSETAKSAYISQPALTKQINKLESELGVKLFDRSKHGVSLTYAGEEFYKYAVDILDSIRQAENRMYSISAGLGFSLLPLEMNHRMLPENVLAIPLDIPEALIERSVGWHKNNRNVALRHFVEMMKEP